MKKKAQKALSKTKKILAGKLRQEFLKATEKDLKALDCDTSTCRELARIAVELSASRAPAKSNRALRKSFSRTLKNFQRDMLVRDIQKLGLGNPHTPYEEELMVAGIKPVAIIGPECVTPEMQAAIDDGRIVKIGEKTFTHIHRIYCQPDQVKNARRAARILKRDYNGKNIPQKDKDFLREFLPPHDFDEAKARKQLLAKERSAIRPVRHDFYIPEDDDLKAAHSQGRLVVADFNYNLVVQVYALADKKAEGRELFMRYYEDGKGYPPLDAKDENRRVGQLLGYTENDIAWSNGTKYQDPLYLKFMYATMDARCRLRRDAMLASKQLSPACK